MPNWLQLIVVLVVLALIAGVSLALILAPVPRENRPKPLPRTADLEQQRDEVLQKLAERDREWRQQRQREEAARISRGW